MESIYRWEHPVIEHIRENIRSKISTAAFGVQQNEKILLAANTDAFFVYVCADYLAAKDLARRLSEILGDVAYLPFREDVLLYKSGEKTNFRKERNAVLFDLCRGKLNGIVLTAEALMRPLPKKKEFCSHILTVKKGEECGLEAFVQKLLAAGYRRTEKAEEAGEFARRGDIVDVFSPSEPMPVRIEFWDTTVEDIKTIDPETMKSVRRQTEVTLCPAREIFYEKGEELAERLQNEAKRQILKPEAAARLQTILSELLPQLQENTADHNWLACMCGGASVTEYLPENALILYDEPKALADKLDRAYRAHYERTAYLLQCGEILPLHDKQLFRADKVFSFGKFVQMSLQNVAMNSGFFSPRDAVKLQGSPLPQYRADFKTLSTDLHLWVQNGYKVNVFAADAEASERIRTALRENGGACESTGQVSFAIGAYRNGYISHTMKTVWIGSDDVLLKRNARRALTKSKNRVFLTPEIGDYVVHDFHGIGLCEGIRKIKGSFGEKDYIVVKYRNDDTLYVPVENSDLLTKYAGSEARPKLSKLGGADFDKVKEKVKSNLKEMAFDLLRLYAERKKDRGFVYEKDNALTEEFAQCFPYEETPDQWNCIRDVTQDMEKPAIMDRLICGDVGFGKTEVAMRAAFKAAVSGKQTAVLAPTTILCEQHFRTFAARFREFGVKVECLDRFRSPKEQKEILRRVADGKTTILIGTHRLLSKDVQFQNLGLLILDEEQRFGVEAKEKLKDLKKNVDCLTLSATPIPRTLHMALTGMRDISVIQTPPVNRTSVESFVSEDSDALLRDVILREISRQGQVFVVYNRVETLSAFAARIRRLVPEASVVCAHGQMKEEELENNVLRFAKGEFDVLICTTIIENGIDLPNANTLVVYDADRLGLSQLYQLRGRVGRSDRTAFAYFIYRENKVLSETAFKRLNSILTYTELGSGFQIAMKDLEIRGAGNVLGKEQHGHMEKVGYDMYSKLLQEAIAELKGEKVAKETEVEIDVDLDAAVPETYIENEAQRMIFYQKAASLETPKEGEELKKDTEDIYGPLPRQVDNLIRLAQLKALAKGAGVAEICLKRNQAYFRYADPEKFRRKEVFAALEKAKNILKLDVSHDPTVRIDLKKTDFGGAWRSLAEFLKQTQCPSGGKQPSA